jgi:hypothetical protein
LTIRYYMHAWQGLLMFLAGIISVLAAFAGYIQAGGGEEVLRGALAKLKYGKAQFDAISLNWKSGRMTVTNLRHADFQWPKQQPLARLTGLEAREMSINLELLPWPPAIESITVRDMPNINIAVSEGLLQSGQLQELEAAAIPPINFENCNVNITIGNVGPIALSGCSGQLRRGKDNEPRGSFSLRQLNGKPFNFKLETLEDGRWVFTGDEIHIDTTSTLRAKENPFAGKLDPVGLLVKALFAGEMGAKGTVSSLRLVVQPATDKRKFVCDGEVGYRNLELALPKPEQSSGTVVPWWISSLLGAGENLWPRWMQVDSIRTGANGRVSFHMADHVLNFACDEGPASAFTGVRQGSELPPLESLKGSVETDAEGQPQHIVLRGFLGDMMNFETRITRAASGERAYELLLEPRPGSADKVVFGKPLWRFASRVQDYFDAKPLPPADEFLERPKVAFEMESDARHFPSPELLPPGMRDLAGHIYAKGRFTDTLCLRLDNITFDDHSAFIYGAPKQPASATSTEFGGLWKAVEAFFGTPKPWTIQDISLRGNAFVQFGPDLSWQMTGVKNFKLSSGTLSYADLNTELGVAEITLTAQHTRNQEKNRSEITVTAGVAKLWKVELLGNWSGAGAACTGEFTLIERDVPLALHPQRNTLDAKYISPDHRRVNRTTVVRIVNGQAQREVK